MAYLTESELQTTAGSAFGSQKTAAKAKLGTKTASTTTSVFLSHSHEDESLVEGLLLKLNALGINVYVDWQDPTMPRVTSPETATAIKKRIKVCKKFLVLATENALASKWVPWELGIADAQNDMRNVAIIPVKKGVNTWPGSEYVGIYSRVETAAGQLFVIPPNQSVGPRLAQWLIL